MAKVVKVGKKFGVAHDTTGAILKRKGKRVIHPTRAAAQADARATRQRITGRGPRITPRRPALHR